MIRSFFASSGFTVARQPVIFTRFPIMQRSRVDETAARTGINLLLRTQTNVISIHRNNPWEFFTECA
jgi:hypothetical protein